MLSMGSFTTPSTYSLVGGPLISILTEKQRRDDFEIMPFRIRENGLLNAVRT